MHAADTCNLWTKLFVRRIMHISSNAAGQSLSAFASPHEAIVAQFRKTLVPLLDSKVSLRLHDIEMKKITPSVHRLYTLARVYKGRLNELLSWYGIPPR